MPGAICNVERGCGYRSEGGIYAEVGVSENGLPLEHFLLDPPILLDSALGVSPRGVTLVPQNTESGEIIYHVADWIGQQHYPNVWDFLAEARNYGISRRLPKSLDFFKLSAASRLLCIHARAAVLNFHIRFARKSDTPYFREKFGPTPVNVPFGTGGVGGWKCPKCLIGHEPHMPIEPCCAGIWAQDVEGAEELTEGDRLVIGRSGVVTAVDGSQYPPDDTRLVMRKLPSVAYIARRPPDDTEALYAPAFFASFPLSRLVVVAGQGDEDALRKASAAKPGGLDVDVVNE